MSRKTGKERELDMGWNHCTMIGGDHRRVKCNYCGKEMHGGVTRLKEHLAGVVGDVQTCKSVPKEIKNAVKEHIFQKKKEKQEAKFEKKRIQEELMSQPRRMGDSDEEEEEDEVRDLRFAMRESRRTFEEDEMRQRTGAGSSSTRLHPNAPLPPISKTPSVNRADPFTFARQGKKQSTIKAAMKGIKDLKKFVGRAYAKFAYYNSIPANACNSNYYHTMADAFATAGPGVPPPTAWEVANTYLDMEVDEIKAYVETFYPHWDEYGCTLMCDGWTTQNRRKIINFLVYSTYGTVFLDSVDATDKFQNGPYIFDLMDRMVGMIGEHRVIQVVTDNGSNYKAAGQLLMQKRQSLYWTPCAAHCIDLIFHDMSKLDEVKNILSQTQNVSGFIYNHGWVLTLMRKETNDRELLRPAVTRFATHFLTLDSIYKHRDDLRRMITSRVWSENVPKFRPKDRAHAAEVYELIHSDNFWSEMLSVIIVMEPLLKVLRMVDSDDKAEMGYLYEAMDRAKEEIKKNYGKGYKRWWDLIDARWDRQLHRDIHAAGYFLNPRLQYSSRTTNDDEVLSGFRHVVERIEPDLLKQITIDKEVELYRMKVGAFSTEKARLASKNLTPADWWSIVGREQAPNLTRLAMRILSQTVSSSNCERNWTTFSLIHTKTRNRLKMDRLKKLVFVHYNMRLRERHVQRKSNDDQMIDLDYIFHEEDPLVEWTCEKEDRLLDDRDNPWLDEELGTLDGEHIINNQPRPTQTYVRKKDKRKQANNDDDEDDDDGSSPDDDQGPSGGGAGTGYNRGGPSHTRDSPVLHRTQSHTGYDRPPQKEEIRRKQNEERRRDRDEERRKGQSDQYFYDSFGGHRHSEYDPYGHRHSEYVGGYLPHYDPYGHRHSEYVGSHSSFDHVGSDSSSTHYGHRHSDFVGGPTYDTHGSYTSESSDNFGGYANQQVYGSYLGEPTASHYMPIREQSQTSPYDLTASFFGPDQLQYSYPSYYYAAQQEGDDAE